MSSSIESLVRPNIRTVIPYSSARSEFKGNGGIFLDANENPWGSNNRYPDPFQTQLKEALAKLKGLTTDQIYLNSGSDAIADMIYRIFCEPGKDKAIHFPPTFGMYTVAANINDVTLISLPLDKHFQMVRSSVSPYLSDSTVKIIFVCSPNNPTGNHMRVEDIDYLLEHFKGIVVIDEAYIDFSDRPSYSLQLDKYPRLIVMQTMSKSWALAGARVGMALANPEIITYFNKIKMPYNVSSISQQAALAALADKAGFQQHLDTILSEKKRVRHGLRKAPTVVNIFPSDTNFLLVQVTDAPKVYEALVANQLIVRNQHKTIPNCLRITIGSPEENDLLLQAFEALTL